jgi:hypothetical protein
MDMHEKPRWWVCYLICTMMIALLVLDYWIPVPESAHKAVACGIILGGYGAISAWVRANRSQLAREDGEPRGDEPRPRDLPLSPVQTNYRRVIGSYKQN